MKTENPKEYCSFAACGGREGVERYRCCYFCFDKCGKTKEGCRITVECKHRQTRKEMELIVLLRNLKEGNSVLA